MRSVPDALVAVDAGDADLALVPIENSIEGSVNVTLDTLTFELDLLVQREVALAVELNLLTPPGVGLGDVRRVMSIPHATAQCRSFLARELPGVELVPSNSTAEAAQEVGTTRPPDMAAIGTRLAAKLYGLEVLAPDIVDHSDNATRFVLVAREGVPAATGHDKTSIVCFQHTDRPGSLHSILGQFSARNINLTKLESRPTKRNLGDYCFFIDIEGHIADELVADALRNLAAKQADVKFLGSYPVGGVGEATVHRRKAASKEWRTATAWVDELRGRVREGGLE